MAPKCYTTPPECDKTVENQGVLVVAYFTVWLTVPELLADFASPLYVAVIVSVPTGSFAGSYRRRAAAQRCCPKRSAALLERYRACRSSWSTRYNLGNEFDGLPE